MEVPLSAFHILPHEQHMISFGAFSLLTCLLGIALLGNKVSVGAALSHFIMGMSHGVFFISALAGSH